MAVREHRSRFVSLSSLLSFKFPDLVFLHRLRLRRSRAALSLSSARCLNISRSSPSEDDVAPHRRFFSFSKCRASSTFPPSTSLFSGVLLPPVDAAAVSRSTSSTSCPSARLLLHLHRSVHVPPHRRRPLRLPPLPPPLSRSSRSPSPRCRNRHPRHPRNPPFSRHFSARSDARRRPPAQ